MPTDSSQTHIYKLTVAKHAIHGVAYTLYNIEYELYN